MHARSPTRSGSSGSRSVRGCTWARPRSSRTRSAGSSVNVGARVMGVAKGGEVLVSSTLRDAVAGSGFAFADHGSHRLKGIDGEWRVYEVTAVDGVRRSLPLSAEESRTRREFTEAVPVHRRRDRILAGVAGGLVVALVAAGILTNALGGDDAPPESGPSEAELTLRAFVPKTFRSTCSRSASPPPSATASLDCLPTELYSVTYASYGTADDLRTAFEISRRPLTRRTSIVLTIHRRGTGTRSTAPPRARWRATWRGERAQARPDP